MLISCPHCAGTGRIDPQQKRIRALEYEVVGLRSLLQGISISNPNPTILSSHGSNTCGDNTTDGDCPVTYTTVNNITEDGRVTLGPPVDKTAP